MKYSDGSWTEVDFLRLRENVSAIRAVLRGAQLVAVVKSDAYGHGLGAMARELAALGVLNVAVAYVSEAVVARLAAPLLERILVLGVARGEHVPLLLEHRITPVVVDAEQARELSDAAVAAGGRLPVHIKLDTGMGRLGFVCPQEVEPAVQVLALPGLDVQGVCTHFSMVEPERKPAAARDQMEAFAQAVPALEAAAGRRLFRHVSSSRGALLLPEFDLDAVRVGIALYGYGASEAAGRFVTHPLLTWKANVMQVKRVPAGFAVGYYASYKTAAPTEIAVLSCGYTDGYQRHLGNVGHVLIGGRRRRVVGRVSMNWIAADLGADSGVKAGDEVVLMGRQGEEEIWADELAKHCETIAYEILTGISRQIPRCYLNGWTGADGVGLVCSKKS